MDAAQKELAFCLQEHIAWSYPAFIHQHPQVHLSRAAFDLLIPQPGLMLGFALIQVQHIELGLAEPHEFYMGHFLSFSKSF